MDTIRFVLGQDLPHLGAFIVILALVLALVTVAANYKIRQGKAQGGNDAALPITETGSGSALEAVEYVTMSEFARSTGEILRAIQHVGDQVTEQARKVGMAQGAIDSLAAQVRDLADKMLELREDVRLLKSAEEAREDKE